MFPLGFSPVPVNYSGQGIIDTDERRAVVRRLTDALYEYLTLDCTEMERGAKARAETPRVTIEQIMRVQEGIEELRDQLDAARSKMEDTVAESPDMLQPMLRTQLEAMLVTPLENSIASQERYLSEMQKALEPPVAEPAG